MIRLRGISFMYPGELEEVDRTAYIAKKLRWIMEDPYYTPMTRKPYESGFQRKVEVYYMYLVNPRKHRAFPETYSKRGLNERSKFFE